MTEAALREKVANTMLSWKGAVRGSATHKKILEIYNNKTTGYKVQVSDAWCAATASAAYINAGVDKWTGINCSCNAWINDAKKRGIWVENDAYVPKIGDAVMYDWDDSSTDFSRKDNLGQAEHVGIVTSVSGTVFYVTEGNKGSASSVDVRKMNVNGRYIRGFIAPNFKAIAEEMTKSERKVEVVTFDQFMAYYNQAVNSGKIVIPKNQTMTIDDFKKMYKLMTNEWNDNDSASYSAEAREWAINNGIISGVGSLADGKTNYAWEAGMTREQFVTMLHRFFNTIIKTIKK